MGYSYELYATTDKLGKKSGKVTPELEKEMARALDVIMYSEDAPTDETFEDAIIGKSNWKQCDNDILELSKKYPKHYFVLTEQNKEDFMDAYKILYHSGVILDVERAIRVIPDFK